VTKGCQINLVVIALLPLGDYFTRVPLVVIALLSLGDHFPRVPQGARPGVHLVAGAPGDPHRCPPGDPTVGDHWGIISGDHWEIINHLVVTR
jgi:hypothetical protein